MKKKNYRYLLFDLDGTLTDPKEGITKAVQYSLKNFGIEEPNLDKLEPFIGPPLGDSYRQFYGFDEEQIKEAIAKFREQYNTTGVLENAIYPGMAEFLADCKKEGKVLAVASSKPIELVHRVLKRFDIEQYFDVIVGSEPNGKRESKIEVMEEVFHQLFKGTIPKEKVLMIGDRKFDVEGAAHFGVDSMGLTFGYADEGELQKAGATYLADSIQDMRLAALGKWQSESDAGKSSFHKTLQVLAPMALYWAITSFVILFCSSALGFLNQGASSGQTKWIAEHASQLSVGLNALAVVVSYPFMYKLFLSSRKEAISPVIKRRQEKQFAKSAGLIFLFGGFLAVGLNIGLSFIKILQNIAGYEAVSNIQYSVSLPIGLFVFGVLTPVGEELIFRGVVYNRLRRYFLPEISIVVSALMFGIYHGNLVQFLYAFLMGLAMAYVYERTKRLMAPVLFHCSANCVVYILSKSSALSESICTVPMMLALLLVAAVLGAAIRQVTSKG